MFYSFDHHVLTCYIYILLFLSTSSESVGLPDRFILNALLIWVARVTLTNLVSLQELSNWVERVAYPFNWKIYIFIQVTLVPEATISGEASVSSFGLDFVNPTFETLEPGYIQVCAGHKWLIYLLCESSLPDHKPCCTELITLAIYENHILLFYLYPRDRQLLRIMKYIFIFLFLIIIISVLWKHFLWSAYFY